MKNIFIINVNYKTSLEEIEKNLASHREYLKIGYEKGILLASGPQNPKTGGIIIGIFNNINEAKEFSLNDPFIKNNLAESSIIEFNPILHCKEIQNKI
ncbi:YciI family protein [Helicobacter sp. MIT 14-3879]|uniref:YciI family protein n=1 Tax=Helicobacter sp. MIT 14-3879 TaxID=2040649 RepID=UPI000E1FB417|nr:YciI family protein [Helicobacter sp. MIT 14-3879]RDU62454.1 GTP cyclohydrolase [Helicobacter sp. MIT 14-3879]